MHIETINLLSKIFKISKFKTSGQGFTLNLMALKSFQHFGKVTMGDIHNVSIFGSQRVPKHSATI